MRSGQPDPRPSSLSSRPQLSTSGVTFDATDPISTGHQLGEQVVMDSGLPWTIVRPGIYLYGYAPTIAAEHTLYVTVGGPVSAVIHFGTSPPSPRTS
ncbi:hypothetical protein ABT158_39585 [Nonomuraea sp. NPDC001636]|uniref:hypothetical protein n=1 Tax=Nonomuraea sp. NPDC001636 TaxID=3154391 RepID=UPI00331C867A